MAGVDAICSGWDRMDGPERRAALTELINETLGALGYEPVTVEVADLDEAFGDYSRGHVRLDTDHVTGHHVSNVLDTAFHEAGHAMEDQDGDYGTLDEDTRDDYVDVGMTFVMTDDGDFRRASDDLHHDIDLFADWMTENAMQHCMGRPTESAVGALFGLEEEVDDGDGPSAPVPAAGVVAAEPIEIDWQEEVDGGDGGDGGEAGFEIVWDEAVITDADDELPDGDADLPDGGGP